MAESVNRWNVNGVYYDIHDCGRGLPGGVATLDPNGRIPYQQLPESTIEYKGTWDASTNTPHLADGTGNQGDMYFCVTSGTVTLGTDRTIAFYIGDRIVYDGAIWERLPAGGVYTVNNKEGDVVLYGTDIQRTADDTKTIAQAITDVEDVIKALDVEDPTSSGNAIAFIKSISQTDGKIEPLKATIPDASATQAGITRKTDTYSGSSTDAMTGKAVAAALATLPKSELAIKRINVPVATGSYQITVNPSEGEFQILLISFPGRTMTLNVTSTKYMWIKGYLPHQSSTDEINANFIKSFTQSNIVQNAKGVLYVALSDS